MYNFNYQKICSDLLSDLNKKQKEIISRRFGFKKRKRETLESVGEDFGVCRERIRQIQKTGLEKMKPKIEKYQRVFHSFLNHFKKFGDIRKEDVLLEELGGKEQKNEVYFLLNQKEPFQRINKNENFYSLWTTNQDSYLLAKKIINSLSSQLKETKKPLPLTNLKPSVSLKKNTLVSYLEISKEILKNQEGLYGLSDWPEINPRGVKDRAYLALKKAGKPLHFSEVADLITNSNIQTVHNELIKDKRFVLVGRGIYALSDWGYYPGQIKDVILKILQEAENPLNREEVLEKVLKQRLVKKNTILLNLGNKEYFLRDSGGKYKTKEA